jgi:hypothetical protein
MFSQRYWEFFFFSIFFILAWSIAKPYFENKKIIGSGDISVLSFVLPVTWFVNPYMLPVFLFLFGVTALTWYRKELFTTNYDYEKIDGFTILEMIEKLAHSKVKDYKSLTNKTIFKFMDMIEA